jgi:hypothetical protein
MAWSHDDHNDNRVSAGMLAAYPLQPWHGLMMIIMITIDTTNTVK